jgi:dipeptidyl-peptidase-3
LTFIHPTDVELYNTWDSRAFELQVANHELLGHGSGKLFEEDVDGKKNFDPEKVSWNNFLNDETLKLSGH